jgi:hypothetical protein
MPLCLINWAPHHETYGGLAVLSPPFLTLAVDGQWSASRPGCFTPRQRGPQRKCWCCGIEKNLLLLPGINSWVSNSQPVAIMAAQWKGYVWKLHFEMATVELPIGIALGTCILCLLTNLSFTISSCIPKVRLLII